MAKATGPVHGSAAEVRSPEAEQLRHAFLRLVREAPAESPKPVDMSVRVRHEYLGTGTGTRTVPLRRGIQAWISRTSSVDLTHELSGAHARARAQWSSRTSSVELTHEHELSGAHTRARAQWSSGTSSVELRHELSGAHARAQWSSRTSSVELRHELSGAHARAQWMSSSPLSLSAAFRRTACDSMRARALRNASSGSA